MKQILVTLLFCLLFSAGLQAQSFAFGLKGGLTVGTQKWDNSFRRDALFRYHGIAFIESAPEDNRFALFAQGGYHIKGSAIRTYRRSYIDLDGNEREIPSFSTPFEFHNISLTVGGKQKYDVNFANSKVYYLLGVRGDYTVHTELGDADIERYPGLAIIYPVESFVKKINYGATLGGGIEIPLGDLYGMVLEFTVNPDFSRQYNQPPIENVINPNPNSSRNTITIPERQIMNLTFELTAGFRFLNIVEYID